MRSRKHGARLLAGIVLAALAFAAQAQTIDNTWTGAGDPTAGWNDPANWTNPPGTVPDRTAIFNNSGATTTVNIDGATPPGFVNVERILIQGSQAFTLVTSGNTLDVGFNTPGAGAGPGIFNTSTQQFLITNNAGGIVTFWNFSELSGNIRINNSGLISNTTFCCDSNAGNALIVNSGNGSSVSFDVNSSAANANVINNGGGSSISFFSTATAANSILTNNTGSARIEFRDNTRGGTATIVGGDGDVNFFFNGSAERAVITGTFNGRIRFGQNGGNDTGTAGDSTIATNGLLIFQAQTTAGNAIITMTSGGAAGFRDTATGGMAQLIANAGASFDFSIATAQFSAGSIAGGGAFYLGSTQVTVGVNNLSTDVSGVISDCGTGAQCAAPNQFPPLPSTGGALIKAGSGTLTLSGNNIYTGGTTIAAGTLQLGNGGASGSVLGPIVNNSVLAINRSDSFTLANNISGTGALNHIGIGNTTLTGANTYTGATNVLAGTLTAGGINAFGVGSAVTVNNATLALNSFNQTIGSLAGNGGVTLGAATLTLANANFSGVISGAGGLSVTGTAVLSGANTYTGGTTIGPNSTMQLGAGGVTGSVLGNIVNNGILAVNQSGAFTLNNIVSGPGAFQQNGSGTTTINNIQTFTGPTVVNGGGLLVNGSLASSSGLTVNPNGFVGGNGILPSTTIAGGTLAPGNSIDTITVQGNLVMTAGSTYAVELSRTASDRTNVTGTAALGGNVAAILFNGPLAPRTYTILSAAGGRTGAFAAVDAQGFPAAFQASLSYTATDVLLTLTSGLARVRGLNVNQGAAATALDGFANSGATPPAGLVTLLNMPGSALPGALSQLTGEVATGAAPAGIQLMNSFLSLMLNPFAERRGGAAFGPAMAYAQDEAPKGADAFAAFMPVKAAPPASFGQRWSVWGAAYGGANKTDGDAITGSQNLTPRSYGFAVGADHRISPETLVGFALAGGGTNWTLSGGLGTGRSDAFQAGVYASRQFGAAYISGTLAYAWHDMSTERLVTFSGDQLKAGFDGNNFGGRIEGGYRFAMQAAGITPYAALQAQSFRLPAYSETAFVSPQFALGYGDKSVTATRTELGSWFDMLFPQRDGARLALRGRAAWANDHSSDRTLRAMFQTLPGASFTVTGAQAPTNLALLSAGAEWRFANNVSLGGKLDGEFSSRSNTYSGAAYARYAW